MVSSRMIFEHYGSSLGPSIRNPPLDIVQYTGDPLRRELADTESRPVQKRSALKQALNNRNCAVLRLPFEISGEIFMEYLAFANSATTKELITPFRLGHICRTWRDIVWSSPRFCRVVRLNVRFHPSSSLVKEWLLRSGQEPLSIYLTWEPSTLDTDVEREKQYKMLKELANVVFRFLGRWRVIDFRIPAYLYRFRAFRVRDRFPLLTCVSLYDLPALPGTLPTIFCDAPHLNEIHFSNCRLEHYILPLHQLTQVSLDGSTVDECLVVLHNSPNLICCTISDIRERSNPTENPVMVAAFRLESLVTTSAASLSGLLDRLTAPVIRELAIDSEASSLPFLSVNSFISRSSCSASLQRLLLAGGHIHGSDLFTCLGLTPSLVELRLSSGSLQNELVSLICPSGCLLPRLETLEYEGRPAIEFLDISRMLVSRWRQGITRKIALLRQVRLRIISSTLGVPPVACLQHPQRLAEGMYLSVEIVPQAGRLRHEASHLSALASSPIKIW